MSHLFTDALYVIAGISLFAGLQQLGVAVGTSARRIHLVLAAACGLWAVTALCQARVYQAEDLAGFIAALRTNQEVVLLTVPWIAWYVILLTRARPSRSLWVACGILLALIMVDEFLPGTLQYETLDGLRWTTLPWGERIARGQGRAGPLTLLAAGTLTFILVSLFTTLLRHFRASRDAGARWILWAFGAFLACVVEGLLVRLSLIDFVELGTPGFTIVIVALSAAALRETTRRLQASKEKYQALFADSPQAMLAIDARERRIVEANATALGALGYSARELLGKSLSDLTESENWDETREGLALLAAGAVRRLRYDRWCLTKDGRRILVDCSISMSKGEEDDGERFIFAATDITQRRRTEEALRISEARVRTILEQSPIAVSCSRNGVTLEVNPAYTRMYGYDSEAQLRGSLVLLRYAPRCRDDIQDRIRRRTLGHGIEDSFEAVGMRKDGSEFPILVYAKGIELEDGPATFAFIVDMSEQRAAQERIRHLAFFDQLTGLANRQLLVDRLQRALAVSARQSRYAALLQLDLDNFKTVNEALGIAEGDLLLKEVAARLDSVVRLGDTVARVGGDKFAILLEDLSDLQAQAIAEAEGFGDKVMRQFDRPFGLQGQNLRCTCSIGVTLFRDPGHGAEEVIKQADIAMYEAKDQGRSTLRFFDPRMQEIIDARVGLESDLREALQAGQFELHYQVQVDNLFLPVGAEALLRWRHPVRGMVPPVRFIELAEETGLIVPIGHWVLEAACAQLRAWRDSPLTFELTVAINVSARQFRQPGFVDDVRAAIARHGVNPARLKLELTESMLVADIDETVATMRALKEIGVKFSLDDFGTGYSSLQYLKRLPLDQLKIDQSFVRDITVDPSDLAIVRTVVAMARSLNVDVIAEGVETEQQRDMLLRSDCQHFQGYLFGRPVPADAFALALQPRLAGQGEHRPDHTPGLRARR
jgi:diguanylate cyclase (GGDEF)-like protein/PAS domain S-box-containing protein